MQKGGKACPRELKKKKKIGQGTSLAVQWLRLCTSTAGGTGSIPGQGTKIPHAPRPKKKKKKPLKIKIGQNLLAWKDDHNLRGKKCNYITLHLSKL